MTESAQVLIIESNCPTQALSGYFLIADAVICHCFSKLY